MQAVRYSNSDLTFFSQLVNALWWGLSTHTAMEKNVAVEDRKHVCRMRETLQR
jgi:hypothetical protein